jgi:hypothetical protein
VRVGILVPVLLIQALGLFAQTTSTAPHGPPSQPLTIGSTAPPTGSFGSGPITVIDYNFPATSNGQVTTAVFRWSATPCPAAVKIRTFHNLSTNRYILDGGEQRGPFDVSQTYQRVSLTPPVTIQIGDVIGIVALTSCGGPLSLQSPGGTSFVVQGDAGGLECSFSDCPIAFGVSPQVSASGEGSVRPGPRVVPFRGPS